MFYEVLLWGQLVWNIPLLVCFLGIAILYAYVLKQFTNLKLHNKQPLLFFLSLGLLCLIVGSPLSAISHLSFSLHMMQMSILYFIVPPLILVGIPDLMFKQVFKLPMIKLISKLFITPKPALFLFALLFLMYHLPDVLNVVSQYSFIQNGFLLLLFMLSFSMWWPIVSPDPKQRFYKDQKKRYAFLSGLILMPACILFIFNALVDGIDNPFLTQITAHLCTPTQTNSLNLLPSPFNTKFDHIMAGTLMLGMHKFGIMLSFRLGSGSKSEGD
ncbi:cytochrome c oxidase assembly protein [Virgibacillus byunsanensis]|uniref:Cytochrome c oxidase assembly protein n=1 Tax=Virgibacillus byunsanensis TaxID=570945 RepID=A0ABW3LQ56_9BACI